MKLNMDCFNYTIRALQDNMEVNKLGQPTPVRFFDVINALSKDTGYRPEDVAYCIRKLSEEKYIVADETFNDHAMINDITFAGHQYLKSL